MRVLIFFVPVVLASEYNVVQQAVPGDERYHINSALDGASLIGQTSCETQTGDTYVWGNISANAQDPTTNLESLLPYALDRYVAESVLLYTRAQAVAAGSTADLNKHCTSDYCAAFASGAHAGAFCSGDHCAYATHGDWAGRNCMGVGCAALSTSGCRTSLWTSGGAQSCSDQNGLCDDVGDDGLTLAISAGDFDECCVGHQGSGCIGEGCAQLCVGKSCGEHCFGDWCALACRGNECGSYCQSSTANGCAQECVGVECGENCIGQYCARSCNGTSCGQACEGDYCATNCSSTISDASVGTTCGQFCVGTGCAMNCTGAQCGQSCIGKWCAKDCAKTRGTPDGTGNDQNGCGAYASGYQSAYECKGHACGEGCHGEECAAYGHSVWTGKELIEDLDEIGEGNVSTAQDFAVECFSAWLALNVGVHNADLGAADDDDVAHGNTTCRIIEDGVLGLPDTSTEQSDLLDGPGYLCTGPRCAAHTRGLGAANSCHGYRCGMNSSGKSPPVAKRGPVADVDVRSLALGTFPAVLCVGEECGKDADGTFAAAFCYGTNCAEGATGYFAGAFCIGNGCGAEASGSNHSMCCAGVGCRDHVNGTCDTAQAQVPGITGITVDPNLFGDDCYSAIDTESSGWETFFLDCASNSTTTPYTSAINASCVVDCSESLHFLFRYYQGRKSAAAYSALRFSLDQRVPSSSSSSSDSIVDNAWFWVFIGIVGVATIGLVGYGVKLLPRGQWSKVLSPSDNGVW